MSERRQRREALIKEYVGRGYSANRIQKELRQQGLGMRRKDLLRYVRQLREKPAPARPERYIPVRLIKRRRMRARVRARIRELRREKKVAIYGTVKGVPRRYQLPGKGKELYKAVIVAVRHPPRKKFTTVRAERFNENPHRYIDEGERWDERPVVKS